MPQCRVFATVSPTVCRNLFDPPRAVRAWALKAARATMPEAAVDEHRNIVIN
jgi:hypothetical protein